jgi:GTP cyclohydrolase I
MTVARETTPGVPFPVTTFDNDPAYEELLVVSDVTFAARCDRHGCPYVGVATVGYLPGARIAGLSKIVRLVEHYAGDGGPPERLAHRVADALERVLEPAGLGVVMDLQPACHEVDGAQQTKSVTRGRLREHSATRREFLDRAHPTRRRR